jgi:two-component system, OmpR family, response regulator
MSSEIAPTTILVVEDEPVVRDVLVAELEDVGYNVIAAEAGEEALAILQDRKRDVDWLFTDIRLPGVIDGWRVADEFRLTHPFRPVVYATAYAPEQARQQLQGSYFFLKPYRPAQIVAAFRRLSADLQLHASDRQSSLV